MLSFPKDAKREIGYNLDRLQRGYDPLDWKPMSSVGQGVKEIRIHLANEYRVLYVARVKDEICVLHAFTKKTQKTRQSDINVAKERYKEMKRGAQ